ncbi:forkhead box protein P3-like isoform X2 [Hyperolius riggenbachi]|uniref:forkhead box protein P3-like isoform X2 n=1 Tax=Hyperolius riggenbachi TaxID=752182 RepID=UPI0035A2B6DE
MPSPQTTKSGPASSVENDRQPDGKGKISQWNRRSTGNCTQMHQHQHPYVMVSPPGSFNPSSYLRSLLHDNKQAVVIHPVNRDVAPQPSVLHLAPSTSSSILRLQPARLVSVQEFNKEQTVFQEDERNHWENLRIKPASLGWAQHESRSEKDAKEDVCKKNTMSTYAEEPPKNYDHAQTKASSDGQDKNSSGPAHPPQYGKKFPCCEKTFADHRHFLRHLYSDHPMEDKTRVQCLIQREVVHNLEEQLAVEKHRLHEMQSVMTEKLGTAHPSKHRERILFLHHCHHLGVSAWPGLDLGIPVQEECPSTVLALRRQLWESSSVNIFQNMTNCVEYYKTNNVRPPFTYASLIRWAILESPQKQLALNEIYQWFTKMFAFFRLNKITWKNAVRHNLSLHKCFVRVENVKGAVWMVDEMEFQRKRAVRGSR